MKKTKNVLIATALFLSAFSMSAQVQFGAGVSLFLDNQSAFGVQGRALYSVSEDIDIAGGFTFYFNDVYDYAIDFNAHYNLLTLGENIEFAPLAGINIFRISVLGFGATNTSLQIGGFFKIPTDNITFYAEPKIILDGGSFVISGGVLF